MNLCLYHRSDLDGQCGGAIYRKAMELRNAMFMLYGIDYGDEIPWKLIDGSDLTIIDWSFQPWEVFYEAIQRANTVRWIDHHRSAIIEWQAHQDMPEVAKVETFLREDEAGCEIAWRVFFGDWPEPEAVNLLGRYDVWEHSDFRVLPFQYGLRLYDMDPGHGKDRNRWAGLLESNSDEWESYLHDGELLLKYQTQNDAASVTKTWFPLDFAGRRWQACNRLGKGSRFFDVVWESQKFDGMLAFGWNGRKQQWQIGLYSDRQDIDCGAIAKEHGGGGHPGAAGFMCQKLPFNLGGSVEERLEAVAESAVKLLRPPYYRHGLGVENEQERKDWESLRDALHDAGYSWEEYS